MSYFPLTLTAQQGNNSKRVRFETPAGARPRVTIELKQQEPAAGVLDFSLMMDRATITGTPMLCDALSSGTTRLTTRLTIGNGTHVPIALNTAQPWRCLKETLKTP